MIRRSANYYLDRTIIVPRIRRYRSGLIAIDRSVESLNRFAINKKKEEREKGKKKKKRNKGAKRELSGKPILASDSGSTRSSASIVRHFDRRVESDFLRRD